MRHFFGDQVTLSRSTKNFGRVSGGDVSDITAVSWEDLSCAVGPLLQCINLR